MSKHNRTPDWTEQPLSFNEVLRQRDELLEACKLAVEWLVDWIEKDSNPPLEDACETRDTIQAAIDKAEGRASAPISSRSRR